jgi:hypothetical protein
VRGVKVVAEPVPIGRRYVGTTLPKAQPTPTRVGTTRSVARPAPIDVSGLVPPAAAPTSRQSPTMRNLLVAVALLLAGGLTVVLARLGRRAPVAPKAPEIGAVAAPHHGGATARRVLGAGPKQLGAAAALVVGVSGAYFVVRPNLKPSTENVVAVTNVAVEPDVTLLGYARHPAVSGALDRAGGLSAFVAANCEELGRVGTVVHLDYEVKGYAEHSITVRWSVIDARTGLRLAESEGNDPLPLTFRASKRDTDSGSWELWVPAPSGHPSLKARIELYDTAAKARLAFKDSPAFPPPSLADRAARPC